MGVCGDWILATAHGVDVAMTTPDTAALIKLAERLERHSLDTETEECVWENQATLLMQEAAATLRAIAALADAPVPPATTPAVCERCKGTGFEADNVFTCAWCYGSGEENTDEVALPSATEEETARCPTCGEQTGALDRTRDELAQSQRDLNAAVSAATVNALSRGVVK